MTYFQIKLLILLVFTLFSLSSRGDVAISISPKQKGLDQAVVYLVPLDAGISTKDSLESQIVQKERLFSPYIQVVRAGTEVAFPNADPFAHHVYSFSKSHPFELPLYRGEKAPKIKFDKSGVVILGCNIHDWMLAYLVIVDTPYFSMVKKNKLKISDIPIGKYQLHLWHPSFAEGKTWQKQVVITAQTTQLEIEYDKKLTYLPQPQPENLEDESPFYD